VATKWRDYIAEWEARKAWEAAHPFRSAPRRTYWYLRRNLGKLARPQPWVRLRWRYQRSKRGWADRDVWSLDSYLAKLIGSSIASLRNHGHGYPSDITLEQWDDVLTRISEPLLAYHKHWDDYDNRYIEEAQQALRLLAEHFPSCWD